MKLKLTIFLWIVMNLWWILDCFYSMSRLKCCGTNNWLSSRLIQIWVDKVRTFWETHTIWKNLPYGFGKWADLRPIFFLIQIQLMWLLVGSLVGLLVGKSYHTKQKDGYSLPTDDPTNNHINWIWMSKKIGLNLWGRSLWSFRHYG